MKVFRYLIQKDRSSLCSGYQ